MRGVLLDSLFSEMSRDESIYFLTADMGINLVERFELQFPHRYLNVGIAEQNLIGVAAGLANMGFKPFLYTISNFLIHRCFEQIRNDIGLHCYPITLIGTSAGFDNSTLGPTHHVVDDWGLLRAIPGFEVYCPSSKTYAESLIPRLVKANNPAYIRVSKKIVDGIAESSDDVTLIKGNSNEFLLIAYGNTVRDSLCTMGMRDDTSCLIFNKLIPLDEDLIHSYLLAYKNILVIEDHFPALGMYSVICELIAKRKINGKVYSVSPKNHDFMVGGNPDYFFKKSRMDKNGLVGMIEEIKKGV